MRGLEARVTEEDVIEFLDEYSQHMYEFAVEGRKNEVTGTQARELVRSLEESPFAGEGEPWIVYELSDDAVGIRTNSYEDPESSRHNAYIEIRLEMKGGLSGAREFLS